MKNKKNAASIKDAVNEEKITPLQLLQEIESLLKECFIGSFEIKNGAMNLRFENGNKFKLTIGEVI